VTLRLPPQASGAEAVLRRPGLGQRQPVRLTRAPAVTGPGAAFENGAATGAGKAAGGIGHDGSSRSVVIIAKSNRGYGKAMLLARLIDIVGALGATLTTLCWLPQVLNVVREKETRALSLPATAAFTFGVALWLRSPISSSPSALRRAASRSISVLNSFIAAPLTIITIAAGLL